MLKSSDITISTLPTMKVLTSLLALLPILTTSFAAKKSASTDVFQKYHAKALSTPSLSLTDSSYEELTTLPRNHSVLIVLTALEAKFGCKICQEFKPEWDILTKSWMNGDKSGNSRLLFGELDFEKGRGTFEKVCTSSPSLSPAQPATRTPMLTRISKVASHNRTNNVPLPCNLGP
jgi:oligosaccharyltransferase complex subunit gamma